MSLEKYNDSDNWRWYLDTDTGEKFLSVTTILDVIQEKKMQDWMKNNSRAAIDKRLQVTADIGNRIHDAIEQFIKHGQTPTDADLQAPFQHWLDMLTKHKIIVQHSELPLASRILGIAGTTDLVGEFEGKKSIMDIKTGFFSKKAGWQMALYKFAYEESFQEQGLGMVGLQIKRDGSEAKAFVFEHYDWCLKTAVAALECFKACYFYKLQKLGWGYLHNNALKHLP